MNNTTDKTKFGEFGGQYVDESLLAEIKRIEGIIEQQKRWGRAKNIKTAESKQKMIDRIAESMESPEEAEKAIRLVIEERMDMEQFSECDITMVDLTKIRMALVNTLSGVYHHRVKYPSIKYKHTANGTKGENA